MNTNKVISIFIFGFILLIARPTNAQWTNISGTGYTGTITTWCLVDSILLLGTEDGIYRSTNHGATLEHVLAPSLVYSIVSLDDTVFALVGTKDSGYVWCSNDKGVDWTRCIPEAIEYPRGLAVTHGYVFVITGYMGYVGRFSRIDWKGVNVDSGFAYAYECSAIEAHNDTLFASLYTHDWEVNVYRSFDQGNHWELCNTGLPSENVTSFATGPVTIAAVTFTGNISISSDGGTSWVPLTPPGARSTCVAIGPSNEFFVGTKDNGVLSTTDFGKTWSQKNSGLTVGYIGGIAASNTNVFALTQSNALFFSTNSGKDWQLSSCNTGPSPRFLINRNGVLFAGDNYEGLFRSTNLGESWEPAMWGLPAYNYPPNGYVSIQDITTDSSGLVAVVFSDSLKNGYDYPVYSLYRSTDDGVSWNKLSTIPPRAKIKWPKNVFLAASEGWGFDRSTDSGKNWTSAIGAIAQAQIDGIYESYGVIFAPSYFPVPKLFRSSDEGLTWEEEGYPNATMISDIFGINEYLFAGTDNNVWRSSDLGKTWEGASSGSPGRFSGHFIAKGDTLISATDKGIGISTDSGDHWYKLEGNLPDNAGIGSLASGEGFLLAGVYVPNSTSPNSLWRMPLSQVVASAKKTVGMNLPRSPFLEQNYPNPFNPTTTIQFALPNAEYATITIFDVLGQKVAVVADGYFSPGEHSIQWNAAAFPSGIYFYKLQTKQYSDTRKLILLK